MRELDSSNFDNNKIKSLKPTRKSRYHQGYVPESMCAKLYSSMRADPIIYRSGLELKFIEYCENNGKIAKWASEPIGIKYYSRLSNSEHTYYPDYIIENTDGVRIIVEIKPSNQTVKPMSQDSRWLKETWVRNVDKWNAARKFADDNGMKFIIVTEKFFE